MSSIKKTLEELETLFKAHEVWTTTEIHKVLNETWLKIEKENEPVPLICKVSHEELPEDQCYMHEEQEMLFCMCHDLPLEDQ